MRRRLRLFPLNTVLFPGTPLSLHIFEPRYRQMIDECIASNEPFGVVLIAQGGEAWDPNVQPYDVGTMAEIVEVTGLPFERYYLSAVGSTRFRIVEIVSREPYLSAEVETLPEIGIPSNPAFDAIVAHVRQLFVEYQTLLTEFSGSTGEDERPDDRREISYVVADGLQVSQTVKQSLLEIEDGARRLGATRSFLERVLPQLRKLLKRRRKLLETHRGQDQAYRGKQEKFFGKSFSLNSAKDKVWM